MNILLLHESTILAIYNHTCTCTSSFFLSLFTYMCVFSRFFGSAEQAAVLVGVPGRRLELKGCLVAGPHSFSHVGLSKELATANPELTLPMFCGKSNKRERMREYERRGERVTERETKRGEREREGRNEREGE